MSVREGLIVALPEEVGAQAHWLRVVDGAVVQSGSGTNWLAACGLAALPDGCVTMLVPPAALVRLDWIAHPDLPARQGRAAARLAALAEGIAPADQLFAAPDANEDPARPHVVAVAARADMAHWLLWAQHHGLDPDIILPAALLIPEPETGFARASVGGASVLRGRGLALSGDMAIAELIGDVPVVDVPADIVHANAVAALAAPPLDMRQGDYGKRVRRAIDTQRVKRLALWSGIILLASLLIALVAIVKQNMATSRLDAESLELARQVLPGASDPVAADAELDRQLGQRGAGGYAFTAPVAGLMVAMQDAPGVSLAQLSRDADGTVRATLAAAKAEDINVVLLALQAAGFTITATSAQGPDGRTLAEVTVRS